MAGLLTAATAIQEYIRAAIVSAWGSGMTIDWDAETQEARANRVLVSIDDISMDDDGGSPTTDYVVMRYVISGVFTRPTGSQVSLAWLGKLDAIHAALTASTHVLSGGSPVADMPTVRTLGNASDISFGEGTYAATVVFEARFTLDRGG